MSYQPPNAAMVEQYFKQVQGVSERVIKLHEAVAFRDFAVRNAFVQIEKIAIGNNTTEKLAKAIAAAHDSEIDPPEIDVSGFDMAAGPKIRSFLNIVSARMSYTKDVANWLNKSNRESDILRQLVVQQMPGQPQGQVQVTYKPKGFFTRIAESIGLITDDEVTTKQETMDYIEGQFKQLKQAEDMWAMLLNLYEEYVDNMADFGKRPTALEIRTFQRILHQTENVVLAVLDKGFRLHMQETARDLSALMQNLSNATQSLLAAQNTPALPATPNGR